MRLGWAGVLLESLIAVNQLKSLGLGLEEKLLEASG